MDRPELSIIIPARNEIYLEKTIRDILASAEGNVEIIVILDGYLPDPPINISNDRVIFLHYDKSIGQRKAVNEGVKIAKGKYIMKLDAHCAVDKGFDVKLIADCEYDWTVIPRMYNLDVEIWKPKFIDNPEEAIKRRKLHDYMYIGWNDKNELRTLYYSSKENREWHSRKELIDDTMSCMGCCFFMHKDRFWELGGMDENHGGWGQMGVEVACKAWLSGGALKVNKKTWFAHWFRGGKMGAGFPYDISGNDQVKARKYSQDFWLNNKWSLQKRDFKWLIDKFKPPTWETKILTPLKNRSNGEMVSIVIPSRNEKFLQHTIKDVLEKATGEIEIFPVLDGYEPPIEEIINDPRVKYIRIPNNGSMQKRQGINTAISIANGKYVMSLDAHCMMAKGFDEILKKDCEDNWIVIPRRHRLNANTWTISDGSEQPPVDYEYWMYRAFMGKFKDHNFGELHGYKWDLRTIERKDILIDDTLTFQGSCWFMEKQYFNRMKFMQVEGYTGWGQEAEELALSTWLSGGRVVVNKNTWYAHLHKGKQYGRMYFMPKSQRDASIKYSFNYWCIERRDKFMKLMEKFKPIPNWVL